MIMSVQCPQSHACSNCIQHYDCLENVDSNMYRMQNSIHQKLYCKISLLVFIAKQFLFLTKDFSEDSCQNISTVLRCEVIRTSCLSFNLSKAALTSASDMMNGEDRISRSGLRVAKRCIILYSVSGAVFIKNLKAKNSWFRGKINQ